MVRPGELGWGVYSDRALRAGAPLFTFGGPLLDREQVRALGLAQAYTIQLGPRQYVDTTPPGRFTNHSCEPNAGIKDDRTLVALRDIAAGEEVCFDYSTTMSEQDWTMPCRCGATSCRTLIEDFHLLPGALQERYVGLGVVQEFIVREWKERRGLVR